MDDSSDFTFCQVAPSGNNDVLESPKIIVDVGNVSLEETHPGPVNTKGNNLDDGAVKLKGVYDGPLPLNSQENKSDKQSGVGSVRSLEVPQPALRRPPRSKVPFEKGFGQMDWLKVTRTHPDLAGLKGKSNRRLISMEEVRQHKTEDSAWTILKGRVYNISPYMKFHPGGADMLLKAAGKDGTSLFNKYHAWVNAEFLLEKCLVGILDESS